MLTSYIHCVCIGHFPLTWSSTSMATFDNLTLSDFFSQHKWLLTLEFFKIMSKLSNT